MTEEKTEISWDDAVSDGKFVKLLSDEPKELVIKEWVLEAVTKTFQGVETDEIEFKAVVIMEDGEECDKIITTTSNRLKKGLRKVLESKDPTIDTVKIRIMKVGEAFNTQYSVKEMA